MSFDLTDRAWLPVVGPDGTEEVSLRDAFRRGRSLRGLALTFAPEEVAVTRILIAVLQAAMRGPRSDDERARWLEHPEEVIDAVVGYLDEWRDRFDLFDATRPFLQQTVAEDAAKTATIAALRLDWASGNNATLFDHHVDGVPPALDPGTAVRALITTLHFQPGGGVSKPFNRTDSPGTKALSVLVQGRTLWETLVANAAAPRPVVANDDGFGAPSWERPLPGQPDDGGVAADLAPDRAGSTPRGWLDRLTWRSRAIELLPADDGMVRHCRIHQHLKLIDGGTGDPFHAVEYDQQTGAASLVRVRSGTRIWRSADAVLHGVSTVDQRPRSAVAQGLRTLELHGAPRPQVLVAGLEVNQAKIAEARSASLPLSADLLADEARLGLVGGLREIAEQGAIALRNACLAYQSASGAERDLRVADTWQVPYWATLGHAFPQWLERLADEAPDDGGEALRGTWGDEVRRRAREALDERHSADVVDPRAWKAHAVARTAFHKALRSIPSSPKENVA
ncbi:MAG: type I-E CRISPR-associated protein Cse1/CasA [Solirubrobacteraceae bacterium]|nr:type I-E CRISPR-associated protein Cse1/CasA [Solirubrobacteraceae bacterium]